MIKVLLRQVGVYKHVSLLTPLFTSLEVVMDVLIPYMTALLIDNGISKGDMSTTYRYGGLMLLMAAASLLLGILAARCAAKASTGFAHNIRNALYRSLQRYAFVDIDHYSTPGIITRMTTDVQNLQNAYGQMLRISVRAPYRLLLSIVMCVIIDARLSLIFIAATVILAVCLFCIIRRVAKLFALVFEQYDSLNGRVQENVSAIRLVKAFVREDYETLKFSKAAQQLYRLYLRAESLMALNHPLMNFIVYACIIALSWWGAHFIVGGSLTTGELASLFTYVMSILTALMMLSMVFVMLTQSVTSARRVAEMITHPPSIDDNATGLDTMADGSITFDRVRFNYHSCGEKVTAGSRKSALFNISFHIESGETIGIIGGTGSGKSTLAMVLCRLYDISSGSIVVGGADIGSYTLSALRSNIAYVQQQNRLFSGTILDNLRWGNASATIVDCRRACRIAQAEDFINEMPKGFDTYIEQGGTNLSGGQRQRLCIARALLKQPRILILDDATSACDTQTDRSIQTAVREQLNGITKLIIAQRISTVQHCKRIIVMDNGGIVGIGSYEELLKSCTLYKEICELQSQPTGDFDSMKKGGDA